MFAKKPNEIGSGSESEKEAENSNITGRWSRPDLPVVPKLETPSSVQAVISRIEQAQLLRAREDVNMQLNDIMNSVYRIITRYTALDLNSSSERKSSYIESRKTRRNLLLEKVTTYAKAADLREKTLAYILAWLEEWSSILSEITIIDVDEHHHWIAQMEMFPDMLKAINNNVKILCKISESFLEEKKKQKKKMLTRSSLWKSWKERAIKLPATAHALRPDQMISDQLATKTKVSEIQDMLQELIGTSMFNTLENNAIKYISSTIINFSKALNTLNDELKIVNFQNISMYVDEAREEENDLSLKIIQDLSEQNEMLTQRLKDAEEKCEQLIRSKVVSGHRAYISSPTFSTLKMPPGLSPQSSMTTEDTMDGILTKEFENIIDESQRKGTKGTGIKWDSAISYTAQVEMTPDLTEQQYILPEKKRKIPSQDTPGDNISLKKDDNDQKDGAGAYSSQNRKLTKDPHPQETSESNLSTSKDEQKASEAKPSQYSELQSQEKKRKRRKSSSEAKPKSSTESKRQHISSMETKSQDQKSGKSMREQLRKFKPEYSLRKGPVPSETKVEPTTKSMDKDTKSELNILTDPFRMIKPGFTSEPQKAEMKGKQNQVFLGTTTNKEEKTEEKGMLLFTKEAQSQQLAKLQSKITKETPDSKSEQSNLELFQKAILAFLKEKIDNTGKPFDKKSVLKEEELLIKAEGGKLGVIKAKMEEYFQKVAETVTKILRKYRDIQMEGQLGEKPIKQKQGVSFTPGLHFQESSINEKSKISSFLSNESTDPIINNLIQMILAEMESERDVPKVLITGKSHKEKGKKEQEKYLQEGQGQMSGVDLRYDQVEVKNLWKESYKIMKDLEEKKASLQMKEGKHGQQEQKHWQKEEVWREQQTQQDEKQKQWESEREEQKPKQQQLEAWKQKVKEQGVPLEEKEREKIQQVQKKMRREDLKMSREKDEERQKLSRVIEDLKKQRQSTAQYQMKKEPEDLAKMITQSPVILSPRGKSTLKNKTQLYQERKSQRNLKTLQSLPDGKHPITVNAPTSTQSSPTGPTLVSGHPLTKYITLSPPQALALGITPTPQEVQQTEFTTGSVIPQTSGITLTSEQAQALRAPLMLEHISKMQMPFIAEQAQEVGTIRTQEQAQASRLPITLIQAQKLKESVIPEITQAIQTPSTTKKSQILGVPITQGRTEALRISHTPQQAQNLRITLTPQQAQALGITLTPQQVQAQGITLTPQQAQDLRITLSPQQVQDLGITPAIQKVQAQEITLTPQQAKNLGIPLIPQQAQVQGIPLTPQQAQDLEITLTPQQVQDLGITTAVQKAQAQGIPLTPQQAQDLGITLTPHQVHAQGITLTAQQAQDLGITLTPQQAQAQGIPLTPRQAQDLGIALTPQEAQDLGITLTPRQAQDLGITLTPQQAQAQGITLTPQQAQALGITLIPQQAQDLGITLTPQQIEAHGITLTPQQAQGLGITLTPQQVEAQGITLTPRQAQDLGITLIPQQVQAQGITLTPQQAQDLGITLTPREAQDLGITLTPQQVEAQGITLTPQQAQDLGITLTPQQVEAQGITLTPQQAQDLGITLTPQQVEAQGITLTPQQAQDLGITLTPQQVEAQGIPLTHQQAKDLGITVIPQQAKDLGITLTPQQKQTQWITLTSQQAQAFDTPLTWQKLATLAPSTLGPFQELRASFSTQRSIISRLSPRPRLPLTSTPPTEKITLPGVSPLQKLRPLLSQTPITPGRHLGMSILSAPGRLLGPQILPASRQKLVIKGQAILTPSLALEVSSPPGHCPLSGAPPTTEQPLQSEALNSSHFFILGSPLTSGPPLDSQATVISRVPPTFGQIPRRWAPLSPGQHLVPGVSSMHREELLESETLAFSAQSQGFQPPATPEPSLQTPSTSRQPLAPWTLSGQVSPLWIPPTLRHTSTLWASPTPGKPQRVLSSVTQKRLAVVSSLKSKSAVVQARTTDFKVSQAPFTTKKVQISEPPATYEETQILQDACVMEPFETIQSSLTSYRTPVSQTPYTDEAVLPTFMKPTSLTSLITQLPKMPQSSPERDQKSQIPSTDQLWILTSVSGTKKPKMMVPPSSPKELMEKRYFVDVEAQRKNLVLLSQATKTSGLPSQQYTMARNLIIGTLHMDTVQLGYLLRKYIAYRLIQCVRNNIIKRLKASQNTGKGYETQNLYIMLSRIDDYQKRVMGVWTEKEKSLEQKRNQCLKKMMHLFSQFQEMYKLNLSKPIPLIVDKKQIPASTKFVPPPLLELLIEEDKKSDIFKKLRQKEALREAIWNADLSTSSYPITEKTSITSLWAQLGGYPDIPRLLQLDIQATFRKSLASIQSR
ncbi:protein FAM186A isoform X2 [Fukomys damarensis]|nr:protein FAM186A isoform X2 [Fukomys damarensis]